MNDNYKYISVETASDIIGICPDNIRKIALQPGFPCVKIGRRYIINEQKLYKWMDDHEGKEIIID